MLVTSQAGSGTVRPGPRLVQGGNALEAGERALGGGATSGDAKITFLVTALDRASGKRAWVSELPAEGPLPAVHEKHNLASPAVSGGRLFIRSDDVVYAVGK